MQLCNLIFYANVNQHYSVSFYKVDDKVNNFTVLLL